MDIKKIKEYMYKVIWRRTATTCLFVEWRKKYTYIYVHKDGTWILACEITLYSPPTRLGAYRYEHSLVLLLGEGVGWSQQMVEGQCHAH